MVIESTKKAEFLNELAKNSLRKWPIEKIIDYSVTRLGEMFPQYRVCYSRIDNTGILTVNKCCENSCMSSLEGLSVDLTPASQYLSALRGTEPVIITNVQQDSRLAPLKDAMIAGNTKAVLDVPLVYGDELVGLLCLDSPSPRTWTKEEVLFLRETTDYLSLILHNYDTQKKLERSEERLRSIFNNAPLGIFRTNPHGQAIEVNNEMARMLGCENPQEVIENFTDLANQLYVHPERRQDFLQTLKEKGALRNFEYEAKNKNGHHMMFSMNARMHTDAESGDTVIDGFAQDITDQKLIEKEKYEVEQRFRKAIEVAPTPVILHSEDGILLHVNRAWREITGYDYETVKTVPQWTRLAYPESHPQVNNMIQALYKIDDETYEGEFEITAASGEKRVWDFTSAPIGKGQDGKNIIMSMAVDITKQQRWQKGLQKSLDERETLIRELYHRTKNNMQVIASMLSLKRGSFDNPDVQTVLSEMISKIYTMALVHEKLYQSQSLSQLELSAYVKGLGHLIITTFELEHTNIKIEYELEKMNVLIDTAVPLGLVINELVTNAVKYAFPHTGSGKITIQLFSLPGEKAELCIQDNGVGMPKEFCLDQTKTLGLRTVRSLIDGQLGGEIFCKNNDVGTKWIIRISVNLNNERV
ncbi:MAG: PAS domain S-box protein [Spirochaetia bacterium]